MPAPTVAASTPEERLNYIRKRHRCTSNCDNCGFCATFGKRDPADVFAAYIGGWMEYPENAMRERR